MNSHVSVRYRETAKSGMNGSKMALNFRGKTILVLSWILLKCVILDATDAAYLTEKVTKEL